jgi:speckle-type POZ protein
LNEREREKHRKPESLTMPSPTWALTAAITGEHRGGHLFNIVGYPRAKDIPTGSALLSVPFMVGGYRWVMFVCPNGQTPEVADFISVSFALMQDVAHPVKVCAEFSFIDQVLTQDIRHVGTRQIVDIPGRSTCMGVSRFIAREEFEKSEHLKFDSFTIRLDLIVI